MKHSTPRNPLPLPLLGSAAALLIGVPAALGQYTPPPPPKPFPGFINEALRKDDETFKAWNIGGWARVRYEVHDGNGINSVPGSLDFRDNGADVYNDYVLERLQLHVGYTGSWFGFYVDGRSSLAQSDQRNASPSGRKQDGPESDVIDLHQAYVTLGNPKEFPLTLKLGRQEFGYADERFVGGFIWNNIGRVFDAAKIQWKHEDFTADLFSGQLVVPVDGKFNERNEDETFSGLYVTTTKVPKHQLDGYVFARNVSTDAVRAVANPQVPLPVARNVYSIGSRLKSAPGAFGPWDYTLDAQGQFGTYGAPQADHLAYAFIGNVGYTLADCPAKPRFALEYAVGSGDGDAADGEHGTFDNLYPTNHKFYGYADFASLQNLHDVRPMLTLKPAPGLHVALEGHLFWLYDTADSFYTVGGAPRGGPYLPAAGRSSFVGSEIDLIAGYAVTKFATVEAGYCHFFAGSHIEDALGAAKRDADFLYLQLLVNF